MLQAMHVLISGLVQGVGFRFTCCEKAQQLGVTGWVKNRQDGRVELWAEGKAVALDQLTIWLQQGPPAARVDHVTIERADLKEYTEFQIKETAT
jgi:acylphosphatase